LKIALLQAEGASPSAPVEEELLASGLRGRGHEVEVLSLVDGLGAARLDSLLAKRGFATPLASLPGLVAQLLRRRYDVAHAFSPTGAEAALIARRWGGGAVIFTSSIPLRRSELADRRLRLRFLRDACEASDAVTAASKETQRALWRWLALAAPAVELSDTDGYERLYGEVAARSRTSARTRRGQTDQG
jgi:hypothetical protein